MKVEVFFGNANVAPDLQDLGKIFGPVVLVPRGLDLKVNPPGPNGVTGWVTFNTDHFPDALSISKTIQFFLAGRYGATSFIHFDDYNLRSSDAHMLVIKINDFRARQLQAIGELTRLARLVKKTRSLVGNKKLRQIRIDMENLATKLSQA